MNLAMITQCLLMINVAAMAAIFVYSACSLSVRQWTAKQPDYWIHSFLVGGSVAVIGHSLAGGQVHHWTEIMFNVAAASYFVMRPAAFRRLCVETPTKPRQWSVYLAQPPLGGCVLKPKRKSPPESCSDPAAFRRLRVETRSRGSRCRGAGPAIFS